MKSSINSQQSSEMGYVITDHLVNETRLLQACAAKAVGRINPFGRSVWALANENGGFIEQYAYDGCCSFVETCAAGLATKRNPVQAGAQRRFRREGNRRDQHNWGVSASSTPGTVTDRGFTGHEHLENFGLIHMPRLLSGGRVYDPLTMQFLSPDPFIQAQGMSANYNRYSYCMNNPLTFTDPSGYIIESMSLPDAIDYLYNHTENGGTWYNTGGGGGSVEVFDSQDDAFEAGVGYINSFGADAWSETEYGSEDKTRLAYKIKSVDFTRLTGYFSYKGYKFFFTISKGKWYIPNSNIEVTDFTSQILHDYSLLVDGANSNSKTGNNATSQGGSENSWFMDAATRIWNSGYMRSKIPDVITLTLPEINVAIGTGIGIKPMQINLMTRGKDIGYHITGSTEIKYGAHLEGGIGVSFLNFTLPASTLSRNMLAGSYHTVGIDYGYGGSATWITDGSGKIIATGLGVSFGIAIGASYSKGETTLGFGPPLP